MRQSMADMELTAYYGSKSLLERFSCGYGALGGSFTGIGRQTGAQLVRRSRGDVCRNLKGI
jgi:hypothetical protein